MIKITDFKGEIPRRNRTMLPAGFAEKAVGARLSDGALAPYRAASITQAVPAGTNGIVRHANTWLTYSNKVSAAQGPIADNRLYVMGDGAPKMRVVEPGGQVKNTGLALLGPPRSPSVTAINRQTYPAPNDPDVLIDLSAYANAPGDTDVSGVPARLVFVRQPEGGVSGKPLVTQPAIAVLDVNGQLCVDAESFEVSIDVASDVSGSISGVTRRRPDNTGVIRFTELSGSSPSGDDGMVLEAFAPNIPSEFSDKFFLDQDQSEIAKDIVFTYTYVTEFDEESAPALPSSPVSWYPDLEIEVADFTFPQIDRFIDRVRIYRSETSFSGITDLYFLAEIDLANPNTAEISVPGGKFTYLQANHPIGEILPSNDYDPAEDGFQGIVAMPNGIMAAFRARELLFSEPYIPHAWPVKYRLSVDSEIMGLVPMGSALAVITKDKPYIAQGLHPDAMVLEKIDQSLPCVAASSIVDLGYAAFYASHRGIVSLQPGSGASMVTDALFSREGWRKINPASVVATAYDGRYLFSYQMVGSSDILTGIIDTTGQTPFFASVDIAARAWFESAETGELFYLPNGENNIRLWDDVDAAPTPYTWRSGVVRSNAYVNFGALIIRSDDPVHQTQVSIAVDVFADGTKVAEVTSLDQPERLPSGFLAQDWQFEARGNATITEITMAGSISDLST